MAEASDSRGHPQGSPPLRTSLLTAIVTVVVLASAGCSSTSDDAADEGAAGDAIAPTTILEEASSSSAVTTTTPDEVADSAIEVVVSALDAKNSLDFDGWLMAFEGGKRQGTPLFAEEILMNANQQWELVEPCQVTRENADGDTVVECLISNIDDFWGTGGIFDTRAFEFHVNPDGLITSLEGLTPNENGFSSDRRNAFNQSYHLWLSDTHPDVFAEMGLRSASSNGPGFDAKDSTHMLVAVDYVEDFVAQSDTYPLDPAEQ
jgi:hypothetical protein